MSSADRICCDGQCSQGRACPLTSNQRRPAHEQRLAPGVIDGPYRARSRAAMFLALVDHYIGLPIKKPRKGPLT